MTKLNWQYNEFQQIGTDFSSDTEVRAYDERMAKLRNPRVVAQEILGLLGVGKETRLLEIGTGTGDFAIEAACLCRQVVAIDVSTTMLEYAKEKAAKEGISNIQFEHAGFLTYTCDNEPFDVVASQHALHHLPDFWKAVALRHIGTSLKKGGRLLLNDVVFSFDISRYREHFDGWLNGMSEIAGPNMAQDAAMHIRDEYSTMDWIMEGMLTRAGFAIDKADYNGGLMASYLCTKI